MKLEVGVGHGGKIMHNTFFLKWALISNFEGC